jgi:2-polyprenyl-6-methoxyphenol hydroxylase-like FAD-dependent oxidoreductase
VTAQQDAGDTAVPDCDVAIVGCGPVGLGLGILLAQRGRSVVVLERWPAPNPLPRAVHIDHEVGRILQSCGLGDGLRAVTEPAEVYEWRNAAGTTLLRFGRIGHAASGWPESSMFCQPELEALLEARARELPSLDVRRGVDVTAVRQEDDRVLVEGRAVDVTAQDPSAPGGDRPGTTLTSRYVVGCDGANSTVRRLTGLDVVDLGFFYDWLIVDVVLDHDRVFDPLNLQVCDPARPTTVVSGGPGRRRWEFMCLPGERPEDLDDATRAWDLLADWDVHPGNARLERHAVYTFQARYAERWRDGRVFVAGDAAHQMPPFAGQGMCAGIRDAANVAWKLDLVLAGAAADDLLDSYAAERLPGVRQAIEFSMELGKVICVADPDEAASRDELMAAAVTDELTEAPSPPGLGNGCIDAASPHAGHLFVQGTDGARLFDDVHGAGWRLVTSGDPAGLDPALAAWFPSIGGRVVAIAADDVDHAAWFADHGASWALQRPDFHLYGAATDAGGAGALLARLRTDLGTTTPSGAAP